MDEIERGLVLFFIKAWERIEMSEWMGDNRVIVEPKLSHEKNMPLVRLRHPRIR